MTTIREIQAAAWANKRTKGFNTTDVPLEFCYLSAEVAGALSPLDDARLKVKVARSEGIRSYCGMDPEPSPPPERLTVPDSWDPEAVLLRHALRCARCFWRLRRYRA